MHPVLSIGSYMILQLLVLYLIRSCLGRLIPEGKPRRKAAFRAFACVYLLLCLLPVFGAMLPDSPVKFALQAAGNIYLGFILYFNGILILLCFCLWIASLLRKSRIRSGAFALCASLAAALLLFAYGMVHAQDTKVKEYDVTIEKDAGGNTDLTLVLLADLHLGVNSRLSTIRNMVELVNRQQPDAVLVAGDIFTSSYAGLRDPADYAAALRQIRAKDGVYAVYGNHDVEETLFGGFPISPISEAFRTKEMEQFFEDAGFTVLSDETALIADDMVQIVGRIDGEKAGDGTTDRADPARLLGKIDRTRPVIVLEHEPVEFAALKESGADLVLCGHTHAGQLFPGNLIVPFFNENAYGYRVISGLDTIVTVGVGYYGPPMRVGTDSEVTVVHVRFRGDPPEAPGKH